MKTSILAAVASVALTTASALACGGGGYHVSPVQHYPTHSHVSHAYPVYDYPTYSHVSHSYPNHSYPNHSYPAVTYPSVSHSSTTFHNPGHVSTPVHNPATITRPVAPTITGTFPTFQPPTQFGGGATSGPTGSRPPSIGSGQLKDDGRRQVIDGKVFDGNGNFIRQL